MNISARKLKKLRTTMRMTQREFAKMLSCSVNSIPKYENGKTSIPLKIIMFFSEHGLCSDYFFKDEINISNDILIKLYMLLNKNNFNERL